LLLVLRPAEVIPGIREKERNNKLYTLPGYNDLLKIFEKIITT
jgi:hypothetical protein